MYRNTQTYIMAVLFTLILTLLAVSYGQNLAEKRPVKRSYVCPPDFIRLSHRCYYFSTEKATWQDAFWKCRDLHSNLAIVRNQNQDKLIRKTLNKQSLEPLERWLGGVYDWEQMKWKWASSGKPVNYQGFYKNETNVEKLRWHCIIVDPQLQFKWSTRSCVEEKHFICHTKIKKVNNRGRKKLQKQYNVNKYKKLNEIPVPDLPPGYDNFTRLKDNVPSRVVSGNEIAEFARRPGGKKKRKARQRKRMMMHPHQKIIANYEKSKKKQLEMMQERADRYKYDKEGDNPLANPENVKWRTYKERNPNPLYPKPVIVEEYNFTKE